MFTDVPKGLESLAHKAEKTFAKFNPMGFESMRHDGIKLSIGSVDIDYAATQNPIFVGDSNRGLVPKITPQMEALFKAGQLGMQFVPGANGKWDIAYAQAKPRNLTGDSMAKALGNLTMDASGPLIAGTLLSPNSISWITDLFKQPLAWSNASKLVKMQAGTNPWAVVQSLAGVSASGWGAVNTAGGVGNTMSQDVEAKLDMLTQQIINIDVTYKLTIEELKRAESDSQSGFPLAGQVIAYKQEYAKWISDIIRDGLIYFGNTASGNIGLLGVNTITAWTSVGSNQALETIAADDANTTKGSKIYQQFANAVTSFLNPMKNKCKKVHATMSVEAFNLFSSVVYSDAYNPANPWQIVQNSYGAGGEVLTGKIGGVSIEIACDPMLSGSGRGNFFNPQTYDYLVLTADELAAGPGDESQSLIHYGQPLADFVYPTMPQQFSTQYRYLKRVSGIFAPYNNAVKVYSGYGYAS